jgi:hypothetical protein
MKNSNFIERDYWNIRYIGGGNSGSGSYGRLGIYKSDVLNTLIKEFGIESVLDLGCGDGEIASRIDAPNYLGFDVSEAGVQIASEKCISQVSKRFTTSQSLLGKAEMTISLDVLYHLIDDNEYFDYLDNLFGRSEKFVVIYTWDFDLANRYVSSYPDHIKTRRVLQDIESRFGHEFRLLRRLENPYSFSPDKPNQTSLSQFFIFVRQQTVKMPEFTLTLTSWAPRIPTLGTVLDSIGRQAHLPKTVYLNIAPEDLHLLNNLPYRNDLNLVVTTFENIGPGKKLIPIWESNRDEYIITIDDDLVIPNFLFTDLLLQSVFYPGSIIASRTHKIEYKDGALTSYNEWDHNFSKEDGPSELLFPTSGAGVLFPPDSLHKNVVNLMQYKELCFHTDDLWWFIHARMARSQVRRIPGERPLIYIDGTQEWGLWENGNKVRNDVNIKRLTEHFGDIVNPSL